MTLEGGKMITAGEAKDLAEKAGDYFFDIRKALKYGKGRVPAASLSHWAGRLLKNGPDCV